LKRKEIAMNTKPTLSSFHVVTTVVAATTSSLIAIGLFVAIVDLFQRDGAPFDQVVIAERACANHAFMSERETCKRSHLTASRVPHLASRGSSALQSVD
jgi:hypothetical protein